MSSFDASPLRQDPSGAARRRRREATGCCWRPKSDLHKQVGASDARRESCWWWGHSYDDEGALPLLGSLTDSRPHRNMPSLWSPSLPSMYARVRLRASALEPEPRVSRSPPLTRVQLLLAAGGRGNCKAPDGERVPEQPQQRARERDRCSFGLRARHASRH